MKRIGISQEWVSAEKRLLRTAASSAMVARERSAFAAANAETRLQTTLAYIDAYFAAEALKLALVNESHAKEAVLTAQSRLASGSGNAQEVLGLASAQGIAEDETADLRQQLESVRISLVRWTGVPVEDLSVPDLPRTPGEQAFVDTNPTTVAKRLELEVNRQEAAITASNRNPNWTWQASYGQRTGFSDMATIGVSIPIPIAPGNRQDRETASKLALVDKAEAELAEAGRIAQAEYRQLVSEQEHHVHRIERYEVTVLATAVQRTATATAAYRSNQASLTTVFDARHAELDARRKILTMQRELSKMRAQLAFKPLRAEEFQ
jgi:cobalt-zinc-cadmium efflux system outer membrane protein